MALLAGLVALPTVAAALPVRDVTVPPGELVKRIRASADVGWSGYAEARGRLVLPDVRELGDVPGLIGGTTRMRSWWRGKQSWRVDTLSLTGEDDVVRDDVGTWTWESADRRATRVYGVLDVRLPQPPDLLPPVLGRRLAGSKDVTAAALPARRVAGRSAAGVRLTPRDPSRTTVGYVDLWAEPRTGLPLRVDVVPHGSRTPAVTALLLDLTLTRPGAARTAFTPPATAEIRVTEAPDVIAQIDRFAPYRLPDELVGLDRSDLVRASGSGGGLATYGDGLTSFAALPLPRDVAGRVIRALAPNGNGERGELSTPLLRAVVARVGRRAYLLAGTVPTPVLDAALSQLVASPPPRLGDR
ncbi:MAG: transcriptional regulator [Actinobacteria bacterium]|nr:transcriptional regulator [Actinomycetota bacterium]MCA1721901.1 transcriptional regulator [Actinomycetota bacterium]